MRMIKKFIAALLVALMLVPAYGCSLNILDDDIEKIDKSRSQLYVGHYNGGFGDRWLAELKKGFEEKYKDRSFEPDRMGVQLIYDNDKEAFHGNRLIDTMESSTRYQVYFTEGIDYHSFMSKNLLYDISDVLEMPLEGEDGLTIEDKLSDLQKSYLKQDGSYYGLPHYLALRGIIYDRDLFEDQDLFFQQDGSLGAVDSGNLSAGPDGRENTSDDGLPATYDDFFKLCKEMQLQRGITPISWTGEYAPTYTQYLLDALWADFQGLDEMNLRHNAGTIAGKNTARIIESVNANGTFTPSTVTIGSTNLEKIKKQQGRYHALDFLDRIIKNNYYSKKSTSSVQKHVMAQADFLRSRFNSSVSTIAMLIDGTWWEEEANPTFKEMAATNEKASRSVRKFGFMPLPKASVDEIGAQTLYDGNQSMCFLNGNITDPVKLELAKLFLLYSCSDDSLRQFNVITGVGRDMAYTLLPDEIDQLSFFGKSVYHITANNDGVFYSWNPSVANQLTVKPYEFDRYKAKINGQDKLYPVNSFLYDKVSGKNVDAVTYFNGLI